MTSGLLRTVSSSGIAETVRVLCCGTLDGGFESHRYLWILEQEDRSKRFSCKAGHQEVIRCRTRGEYEDHASNQSSNCFF